MSCPIRPCTSCVGLLPVYGPPFLCAQPARPLSTCRSMPGTPDPHPGGASPPPIGARRDPIGSADDGLSVTALARSIHEAQFGEHLVRKRLPALSGQRNRTYAPQFSNRITRRQPFRHA